MSDSSIERAQARLNATGRETKNKHRESDLQSVAINEPADAVNTLALNVDGLPNVDGAEDSVKREVYEEFRVLKRALLGSTYESSTASPENLIMVTSITGKAGKTFASLMLARSLSMEPNKHALLVDADVFNNTLTKQFSPSPSIGLGDFLLDENIDTKSVIYPTDVDRLRVIPMGSCNPMMNELLNSDRMSSLLQDFKERYKDRLVIFDAPPLLRSNVAMTLAEKMDQIIILIEPGVTKTADLKSVQEHLPSHVEVKYVLNKSLETNNWAKE